MSIPTLRASSAGLALTWLLFLSSPATALRATEVGGTIASNTTWTLAASPFVATTNVTVPTNVTLTIEAGGLVQLGSNISINAQAGGVISIAGTPMAPVRFRSLDGTNHWGRLGATGEGANLTVKYLDAQHGQTVVLDGASGLFEACYFHDHPGTFSQAILLSERAASLSVRACHFRNYGETLFRFGVIEIEDSLFEDITGDGIDFDTAAPGSVVRRCTLRHGPLSNVDGIDLGSDSGGVRVEHCLIYGFPYDKGVSIGERSTNITVQGCVIYGVDMGVAVKDSSDALLVHNTIAGCNSAFRLYEKTGGQGGGLALAWNNVLWDATNSVVLLDGSSLTLDYSDVAGAGVYPGTSNFNASPLFLNAALGDYRLATNSPCIGAGTNGATLGALFPVGSFLVDTDGDGLPDPWEDAHALDRFADDAGLDPDKDGFSNGQEYLTGTDPQNAASALALLCASSGPAGTDIRFEAVAGKSYTVLHTSTLSGGAWQRLTNLPPQATTTVFTVHDDEAAVTNRFYRLVTPALP